MRKPTKANAHHDFECQPSVWHSSRIWVVIRRFKPTVIRRSQHVVRRH